MSMRKCDLSPDKAICTYRTQKELEQIRFGRSDAESA